MLLYRHNELVMSTQWHYVEIYFDITLFKKRIARGPNTLPHTNNRFVSACHIVIRSQRVYVAYDHVPYILIGTPTSHLVSIPATATCHTTPSLPPRHTISKLIFWNVALLLW